MPVRLEELAAELERGRVFEVSLRDKDWHLDGLQSGESIYIDPRPAVLETVLHELIHRRYRRLSERTVTREARRLLARMDETTKRRWWRAYQQTKRKGRPVDVSA